MEFGRVPEKQLSSMDFSLPQEPVANSMILKGKNENPRVYIGCAKWGRKEWVGKIYPKGTKAINFLDHYVKNYNSIELNSTYHNLLGPTEISAWAAKAKGRDFKFCPKVTKLISHESSFVNTATVTNSFVEGIRAFGENLGPVFLQVSEYYNPKERDKLFAYLQTLPKDLQFFLEVRHEDWFAKETIRKELFDTLRSLNIGAVITDTAGRRDCAHMELTVPKTFIRYVGNSLHETDYTRIDAWIKRMKFWLDNGLQEIYFFMHMHDEAFSPELTVYLVDELNAACNLHLIKPQFVQTSLFTQFNVARKRT
ncbi:MAG: DUF72 domain-containing protein [Bacteroidetes bacterium]|nr:DUF72 domain-containing protein [Bacteroidota bacterium]